MGIHEACSLAEQKTLVIRVSKSCGIAVAHCVALGNTSVPTSILQIGNEVLLTPFKRTVGIDSNLNITCWIVVTATLVPEDLG